MRRRSNIPESRVFDTEAEARSAVAEFAGTTKGCEWAAIQDGKKWIAQPYRSKPSLVQALVETLTSP